MIICIIKMDFFLGKNIIFWELISSHKILNILFHIRKFLSDKDALNSLNGSELSVVLKGSFW